MKQDIIKNIKTPVITIILFIGGVLSKSDTEITKNSLKN